MVLNTSIDRDNLESVTGYSDEMTAAVMLYEPLHMISAHAKKGVPSAAVFQQRVQVLNTKLGEFAGSASKGVWVDRIAEFEDSQIGPVKTWLSNLLGGEQHPVLQKSIDWIEQYGDSTSTAVQMLLADLYMAVGESEQAKTTYANALRMHRENKPEVPLMQ